MRRHLAAAAHQRGLAVRMAHGHGQRVEPVFLAGAERLPAAICSTTAWIETFTPGSAMRSLRVEVGDGA